MDLTDGGFLKSDLHVHSIASGHAFGTVSELLSVACDRDMLVLGISDHGPSMDGAAHEGYFTMAPEFVRWEAPVKLLFGCEANILNKQGDLDLSIETLDGLDYVMAGLHSRTPFDDVERSRDANTQAVLACFRRYRLDILTHPLNPQFPLHLDEIVQAAVEYDVALEINSRLLWKAGSLLLEEHIRLIEAAAARGASLIIGSDAHIPHLVGDISSLAPLTAHLLTAEKVIVNRGVKEYLGWLDTRVRSDCRKRI